MNLFIIILLSIIAVFDYYSPFKKDDKSLIFKSILSFILFVSIFSKIDYFNDRYNYEVMFENIELYDTDFIFKFLTSKAHEIGLEFDQIYFLHILVMALFCTIFLSKFTNKVLIIILLISIFRYVDYANQIRYYSGFFIALYSLYLIIVKKKNLLGILLAVISVLSHSSLIILYIIPFLQKLLYRLSLKYIIIINIGIYLFLLFGINVITQLFPDLVKYFINPNFKSSLLGGIFDSIPAILTAILVIKNHIFLKKQNNPILNDPKYKFLYSLSIFSLLFISSGFFFRIIMERYVFSFILVWLSILIYSLNEYPKIKFKKSKILLNSLFIICWFYFAPHIILGSGFYLEEALLMLGIK